MDAITIKNKKGVSLSEFAKDESVFAFNVDNQITRLDNIIQDNKQHVILPLTNKVKDGNRVYEASLRLLIKVALYKLDKSIEVSQNYGINKSIYLIFHHRNNHVKYVPTKEFFDKFINEINELIKKDLPIQRTIISKQEAIKIYTKQNDNDVLSELKYRPESHVHIDCIDGVYGYAYQVTVPSTKYLTNFKLLPFENGMLLCYPREEDGGNIPPLEIDQSYFKSLKANHDWAKKVKLNTIAEINQKLNEVGDVEFIGLCESFIDDQYHMIGEQILARKGKVRIIMIAGPSSSSKTTFAKRLKVYLMSLGLNPIRISLDDYYYSEPKVFKNGKPDYECIESIDVNLIQQNLKSLIEGKETSLPYFDFAARAQKERCKLTISKDQPIIIEGIHALNPKVTQLFDKESKFGIYIAPQAQVNLDNMNPMSLTDLRLLRRIVRDKKFRKTNIERTLGMWADVREGEYSNIYPYQKEADFIFNSYYSYELCALKTVAMPMLKTIDKSSPYYTTAQRLIKFMKYFPTMKTKNIPSDSLIREFIGGSSYAD